MYSDKVEHARWELEWTGGQRRKGMQAGWARY